MKTLLLLRHAKSSWKEAGARDFDRPLNERGRRAAPVMGAHLRTLTLAPPALILCSPAERARQTAALFSEAAGLAPDLISYDERIYEASVEQLLEVVSGVKATVNTLLFIGHNPGLTELIQRLTGDHAQMRTATLARLELDTDDWNTARTSPATLAFTVSPKDLAAD